MKWGALLFILLITVFFTVCIPAAVAGMWCWRNRGTSKIVKRTGFVLFAVSFESLTRLFAAGFGFVGPKPQYSIGYAICYWIGQCVLAAAVLDLLALLLGGSNNE